MSRWERERRLDWIDDRFASGRPLRRKDVTDYFGISVPQASKDIADYLAYSTGVTYDRAAKQYVPTDKFKSIRSSTTRRRTAWQSFSAE